MPGVHQSEVPGLPPVERPALPARLVEAIQSATADAVLAGRVGEGWWDLSMIASAAYAALAYEDPDVLAPVVRDATTPGRYITQREHWDGTRSGVEVAARNAVRAEASRTGLERRYIVGSELECAVDRLIRLTINPGWTETLICSRGPGVQVDYRRFRRERAITHS